MFEVFNKRTERDKASIHAARLHVNRTFGKFSLNLNAAAVLKVRLGDKIQLLRIEKTWYIAKCEGEEGFNLILNGKKKDLGLKCHAKYSIFHILRDYNITEAAATFEISETSHELAGHPVYQIKVYKKA